MLWPEGQFRNYQAALLEVVGQQEEQVAEVADALVEAYGEATGKVEDVDPTDDPAIQQRLRDIQDRLGKVAEDFAWGKIAESTVVPIIENVNVQFEQNLQEVAGVNPFRQSAQLRAITQKAIQQQVDLIKTIPERHFEDIEERVYKAVEQGWSTDRLRDEIPATGQKARWNATRIARDQTGTVTGEVTKARHEQAGLKTAVWDTIGDGRVRPDHKALHGTTFNWEEGAGPNGIIPGEEIMCRCVAQTSFVEASSRFAGQRAAS